MSLNVLTAGLPLSAKDILLDAINTVFGEGVVEVVELNKDKLRQRVHLSYKNIADILVILDEVSTDYCRDIEGGLYNSDKFYTYVGDRELVDFLNGRYDLNIEIQEEAKLELSSKVDEVSSDLVDEYRARLTDKDLLISNLQNRIKELEREIDEYGYLEGKADTEIDESVLAENIELKGSILDLEKQVKDLTSSIEMLKVDLEKERGKVADAKEKYKLLMKEYDGTNKDLTDIRVAYSQQSGVLRDKVKKIEELQKQLDEVDDLESKVANFKAKLEAANKRASALSLENSNLKVDLSSRKSEIERLTKELEDNGSKLAVTEALKEEVKNLTEERDSLLKQATSSDTELGSLRLKVSELSEELETANRMVEEQGERIKEDDEAITTLNKNNLEMQGRLKLLEVSSNRDVNVESVMSDLEELRRKYEELAKNVFSQVSSMALPRGSNPIYIYKGINRFNNIKFAFAGSTESRKGAYKCILNECRQIGMSRRVLIVDVVSETSIDYVFEINKVNNGVDWFRKGGSVQGYLSQTCLGNTFVLSPGVSYINDSYFLTIDWNSRLKELESSGYRVIVFCGDLSNIIGRVLHESFAGLGESEVYVHGNAIGSRTIVSNIRGLTNGRESVVSYFEFSPKMKRFYDMVAKSNQCRVLSTVR